MKNLFLALTLTASIAQAQDAKPAAPAAPAPATPAAPPAAPADPAAPAPAAPAPAATAPDAKAEKVKPFSQNDQKFAKKASEVLQYQLKLAERARGMKEKDPTIADWAGKKQKDLTALWTPFATMSGKYGYSDLATDISKKETSEIAKLSKVKEEKFRVEYLEMFAKESKAALKDMENAPKMVQNAELKTWAENLVKTLKANAEEIDTKFKEEKKRK